jgi:diguanylate cyclase (GGDEF)-like protein
VDDDIVVRERVRGVLDSDGFEVILAKDGSDGISAFLKHEPDLVLVDAVMPLVDGFEFCTQLKDIESSQFTPVLMITSLDDGNSIDRAFAVGATDYITKPINLAILRQRIKSLIQQSQLIKNQHNLNQELQQANQDLHFLATSDSLTKIANRHSFDLYLRQEWEKMSRIGSPISLIFIDVDRFKLYNDRYHHINGDKCLMKIAMAMRDSVRRASDLVARYGGEEFAVILPNTEAFGALQVAENIRRAVRLAAIPHEDSPSGWVTISLGVTTIVPQPHLHPEAFVDTADRALYQAKSQGRDRAILLM